MTDADQPCVHCGTTGWGSDHASDCPNNPVPGHGQFTLSDLVTPKPTTPERSMALEEAAQKLAVQAEAARLYWQKIADKGGNVIGGISVTANEAQVASGVLDWIIPQIVALSASPIEVEK